jgi:hypothetical protein
MKPVKPSFIIPSPDTFVKSAIKTVGLADESIGYLLHTFTVVFFKFVDYLAPSMLRAGTLIFYNFVRRNHAKIMNIYENLLFLHS